MGRLCIMHWDKKHKILFEEPNRILEELRWTTLKIELQELMYEKRNGFMWCRTKFSGRLL